VAAGQVEIVWWDGDAFEEYIAFWDELIRGYTKENPKVAITIAHAKNFDSYVTASAGGAAPDIYFMWDGCEPLGSWVQQGIVVALDEHIAAANYDVNDMTPGSVESVRYQGKIWGIPELADVHIEQRNLNHYRQAGLPTDPVETLDVLYDHGDKLMVRDSAGDYTRLGLMLPTGGWQLWQWLWTWDGKLYDPAAQKVTPDDPGVIRAVQELANFYKKYGPDQLDRFWSSQGQGFSAEDPFIVGHVSLRTDGDWMCDVMKRYAPEQKYGEAWDAFPVPYSKEVPAGKLACHVSPYPLVLSASSRHAKEAFAVMIYMQDLERTVEAGAYMANVPQTKSALQECLKRKAGSPGWDVAVEFALNSPNQRAFPVMPIAAEYSDRFHQEVDLVIHGKKTAEESLAALRDELQQSLDKALRPS
jgi:multiple sugar transport system substrate-binding protein